jgi:hypothetical protein
MINQKETATSVRSGIAFSGLMGILKIPLFFAPFVFLHGCTMEGAHNAFVIVFFIPVPTLWPFVLVPLATLVAIILFVLRQRATGFALRTKFGLSMSALSLLGLTWTGWTLTRPDAGGDLLWGFWALLACDMGMIGGYAYQLAQLPNRQQPPDDGM